MLLAALASLTGFTAAARACAPDHLDLRGPFGTLRFSVELADDAAERGQGLMFRENLPRFSGMLFVYDRVRPVTMWMKNTLIPLDMLFVDPQGVITHVHEGAVPGDLTSIPSRGPVAAVLEINAGLSSAFGIAPGAEIRHPAFGTDAAWACD
ncbi:MAG: DUF192 domain-containing protein [Pseudomonadota bacterium]